MNDRLSTADLAGGTAATTRPTDPAMYPADRAARPGDMTIDERDPARRADHDRDFRPDHDVRTGAGMRADTMPRDPAMGTTPHRASGLPNPAATDGAISDRDTAETLFPTGEAERFRTRWMDVQTGFVDEPRSAVEQADSLVAEMMKRLAQVFADERGKLEEQWSRGDDISTEDLRLALRRYRSFMDRLLSV